MTALIIIAIRLLVPLAILRWPFWGALAAIAADASDVIIRDALGASGEGIFGQSQQVVTRVKVFDK